MYKKIQKKNSFVLKALPLLFGVLQVSPLHLEGASGIIRKWDTQSNSELNEWYGLYYDGKTVDFGYSKLPWIMNKLDPQSRIGLDWCEMFWHLDSVRRANLWDEMDGNERWKIVRELNEAELLQLFGILSGKGQGVLSQILVKHGFVYKEIYLSDDMLKKIFSYLPINEFRKWLGFLGDEDRMRCLRALGQEGLSQEGQSVLPQVLDWVNFKEIWRGLSDKDLRVLLVFLRDFEFQNLWGVLNGEERVRWFRILLTKDLKVLLGLLGDFEFKTLWEGLNSEERVRWVGVLGGDDLRLLFNSPFPKAFRKLLQDLRDEDRMRWLGVLSDKGREVLSLVLKGFNFKKIWRDLRDEDLNVLFRFISDIEFRKLWKGLNGEERTRLFMALRGEALKFLLKQLLPDEFKEMWGYLSDKDRSVLFDHLSRNTFEKLCKKLNNEERVHWFRCLNEEKREFFIGWLDSGEILPFVSYDDGSNGPVIRSLSDKQRLIALKGDSDFRRGFADMWKEWNMLSDSERQRVIAVSNASDVSLLFHGFCRMQDQEGSDAIYEQFVSCLEEKRLCKLFLSAGLHERCDDARVLLWKYLDLEIRRKVWDAMSPGTQNIFLRSLDEIGYGLLKDILTTEERVQLWLRLGHDGQRVLLWCSLTDEEREQFRQNPNVQREGPAWLISNKGRLTQWYRALANYLKRRLVVRLSKKNFEFLWSDLAFEERVDLGCSLSFCSDDSEQFKLLERLWVDKMSDGERASVWSNMVTDLRVVLWSWLLNMKKGDPLLYLRQDEYEMVVRLDSYFKSGHDFFFEDWEKLNPRDRFKSFWLLRSQERTDTQGQVDVRWKAWNMLESWAWEYCFKHLSIPLKLKVWNWLSPKGKQRNIWYLSEEQRAKLYIIPSEETKNPAFLPNEISMDRRRFAQLSLQAQNDFYKRVAESIYVESYEIKGGTSL